MYAKFLNYPAILKTSCVVSGIWQTYDKTYYAILRPTTPLGSLKVNIYSFYMEHNCNVIHVRY